MRCSNTCVGRNSATLIEAKDGKVAGTIDLGGGPEFAAADGNGYVYNNLEDESLVLKINSRTLKVEQRWPTAPCASPSSMAMDRDNRKLFLGCRSKVMAVMNADTGQVVTTLPIGDHVDATAFDVETRLIFNSNGEGTVTVIRQDIPDKYSIVETVQTLPRAKTSALDPRRTDCFCRLLSRSSLKCLSWGSEYGEVNEDFPEIAPRCGFSGLCLLHAFPFADASPGDPTRCLTIAA
jgi:hypothetical protein